jgi:hypothetical protein
LGKPTEVQLILPSGPPETIENLAVPTDETIKGWKSGKKVD